MHNLVSYVVSLRCELSRLFVLAYPEALNEIQLKLSRLELAFKPLMPKFALTVSPLEKLVVILNLTNLTNYIIQIISSFYALFFALLSALISFAKYCTL